MILWKPPALKIVLISLGIGIGIMYVLKFIFVLELARNIGLIISGIIIVIWDLIYKRSIGRKWDDGSVSTFFVIIPTFVVGALLVLSMLVATVTSPNIDLSAEGLGNHGLPWSMRNTVLNVAESGSMIISAEKSNVDGFELWCVATKKDGVVDNWTVQEGRIQHEVLKSGFETFGCENWNGEQ